MAIKKAAKKSVSKKSVSKKSTTRKPRASKRGSFPILKNWGVVWLERGPFQAPEQAGKALIGEVYGRKDFPDGARITTSRIVKVKYLVAETETGSTYELSGPPSKEFVKWCKENGIPFDPKDPFAKKR